MLYSFDEYELDLQRYELRYAGKRVKLEPQVFNLLVYLIEHRERVVTKEELFEQLWQGRVVGEAALTSRLTAARRAIGDRGREQRLIQTVHGRGYRFIAPVEERSAEAPGRTPSELPQLRSPHSIERAPHDLPAAVPTTDNPPHAFTAARTVQAVGREAELARLNHSLQQALHGTRQVVFVTGDAGLGKTTLVEMFLQQFGAARALRIGRGQCVEHYGSGEAYLPVLEALGRMCREPGGQELIAFLIRQAPTWVVQMPWLITDAELEALQRRVLSTTQERMLREMAEAITVLAAERPLILVLEDLHWSDPSTLDLLTWLARSQDPARLLVLGTYRPADAQQQGHPLHAAVHELKMHRRSAELSLTSLTEAAVAEYLTTRFPETVLPDGLAHLVHQRTDGNPLFMVNVVDAWEAHGWLEVVEGRRHLRKGLDELAQGVPESLRQMLAQQLERLSVEEQRVLEAASVAGVEFSAAAVAAGLDTDVVVAETRCEGLARRQQWLRSIGVDEWPDGTVAGRYAFIHALYHHVVYHRVTAARHVHLHRRIGASKEVAFGPRASEIAAELAVHFEHGRDARRAAQYLQQAGENAIRRCANQEAIRLLTKGLELLITLPDTPERSQQELVLQTTLGPALMVTKGWAASEVKHIYARARELCWQVGETPHLFAALHGLCLFYLVRAELQTARELGEQLLALAQRMQDPSLLLEACWVLGDVLFFLGEFAPARDLAAQGLSLYEPQQHRALAFHYGGSDSGVGCGILLAWALWYLGYPEQALQKSQDAITLAQELAHPYSLVYALNYVGRLHQCRGEGQAAQQRAEAAIALCTEQGFGLYLAMGAILRGWALAAQGQGMEGIVLMHQGLAALRATGGEITRPYWLALLAEAYGKGGQAEEEFAVLTEALGAVDKSGERFYEAELHRLKGELMLSAHNEAEVEACFHQALAIARHQQAKSLELRAAVSLSRLWQQQGKRAEAYDLLAPIYGWFTEGFDTADLQEAKALLEELS